VFYVYEERNAEVGSISGAVRSRRGMQY